MDVSGRQRASLILNPPPMEEEQAVFRGRRSEPSRGGNPQHQGSEEAMERRLNPAGTVEWHAPAEETTDEMAAGEGDGNRFFRGVIAAGLISIPFWVLAGWFLVAYLVK
jgi:hypothetical protein